MMDNWTKWWQLKTVQTDTLNEKWLFLKHRRQTINQSQSKTIVNKLIITASPLTTLTTLPPTRTRPKAQRDCSANSREGDAQRGRSSNSRELAQPREGRRERGRYGVPAAVLESAGQTTRARRARARSPCGGVQDEADPNFQLALHFAWSNFRCGRGIAAGEGKGFKELCCTTGRVPAALCRSSSLVPSAFWMPEAVISSVAQSGSTLLFRGLGHARPSSVNGLWVAGGRPPIFLLVKSSGNPVPCSAH